MAEKVTIMKLKVDLDCEKCYKKVKKLLCKYPQIRDQVFHEKENIVIVKVICCSPEKIRDKLCYKGGGSIKSIEIVEPPKSQNKNAVVKPKKKKRVRFADEVQILGEPKAEAPKAQKPKDKPAPAAMPIQPHVAPPMAVPVGMLYTPGPYYEGRPVGPDYDYGGPILCYDGYYARPVYDSYGGGSACYVNRYDEYFSDENQSGCTIM